jgi:hypothetical protein
MLSLKEGRGGLGWLTAHKPVTRVGASIDLYFLPPPAGALAGFIRVVSARAPQ